MVNQTNNISFFSSTMDITSTPSKKGRIEHRNVSQSSFRTKLNINVLNIARSYLSLADFKTSLFICKEWNGVSLQIQIDRYLSLSPERVIEIILFAKSNATIDRDKKIEYVKSAFDKVSDSWKKAFFLAISKLRIFNFFSVIPDDLRLPILKKASQLEVIDIFEPSTTEIQTLAVIPNLHEVVLNFLEDTLDDYENILEINVMPLFRNDALKKLHLTCRDAFLVDESGVKQYAPSLEVLTLKILDWYDLEIEDIDYVPKFTTVIKKLPSLKKLTLDMEFPCLDEFIDSLPILQELELQGVIRDLEGLNKAYSLKKLIFRDCFINFEEEAFENLYDYVSNLPNLKNIHFIMEFNPHGVLEEMVKSEIATISDATIHLVINHLPVEIIKIKTIFLHLYVYTYSDFSLTNPKVMLLKKCPGLKEIHLTFYTTGLDLEEKEKEDLIKFFQEFAKIIYSIKGVESNSFFQDYLKRNPFPNYLK